MNVYALSVLLISLAIAGIGVSVLIVREISFAKAEYVSILSKRLPPRANIPPLQMIHNAVQSTPQIINDVEHRLIRFCKKTYINPCQLRADDKISSLLPMLQFIRSRRRLMEHFNVWIAWEIEEVMEEIKIDDPTVGHLIQHWARKSEV